MYCPLWRRKKTHFFIEDYYFYLYRKKKKDLFHKLRSSKNKFKRIIIEPRNKIENSDFLPTPFLLLCRDENFIFSQLLRKFPQLLARNPLYSQEDSQWHLFSFLCISRANLLLLAAFKHGLCHQKPHLWRHLHQPENSICLDQECTAGANVQVFPLALFQFMLQNRL